MRANVFTDGSLARFAGQFAWLALDTEKERNAPARAKLAPEALPSFFVVDASTEKVVVRWTGGATAPQLAKILTEAREKWAAGRKGKGAPAAKPAPGKPAADEALVRADAAYGEAKYKEAAAAYAEALASAPEGWSSYPRAVESMLFALDRANDPVKAVALARTAWPKLRRSPSAANVASSGLGGAMALPEGDPERPKAIAEFEAACREVVTDRSIPASGDDRSGVYLALLDARDDAGDADGRKKLLGEWIAFLEAEAAAAPTPEARSVFDSHRLTAAIQLGTPERAIPALEASEKDFPDDYNPPARLAGAYEAMGKWDQALAASDRALAKVYGPRKLNVWETRAKIFVGKGDREAARNVLQEALRYAEALPVGQRSEGRIASLKKKIAELSVPAAGSGGAAPAK